MAQPRPIEPRPRQRQHVERQIEAEAALEIGAEQFEHAAGAGAEIEQRAERPVGERRADRLLDRLVGDVKLADAVPLGGVAREIVLRSRGPRGADGGQPLAVARHRRVGRIEPADQFARQRGAAAALAQPEKRPRALAEPLHQARFRQKLEMPRNPRLRLPQNVGEIRDRQLRLGQKRQDAQPRPLPGGLERAVKVGKRQLEGLDHGSTHLKAHIKISLYL